MNDECIFQILRKICNSAHSCQHGIHGHCMKDDTHKPREYKRRETSSIFMWNHMNVSAQNSCVTVCRPWFKTIVSEHCRFLRMVAELGPSSSYWSSLWAIDWLLASLALTGLESAGGTFSLTLDICLHTDLRSICISGIHRFLKWQGILVFIAWLCNSGFTWWFTFQWLLAAWVWYNFLAWYIAIQGFSLIWLCSGSWSVGGFDPAGGCWHISGCAPAGCRGDTEGSWCCSSS